MNWDAFLSFAAFSGVGIVALMAWWVIYDVVLTRGYPVRDAVFGRRPNAAVALDMLGGMIAMGILVYSIVGGPQLETFVLDIEAVALSLLGTIILLALVRMLTGSFLRLWFGQQKDAHGQVVTFNNELFRQHNIATGIFSSVIYLILAAGLVEQDLLDLDNSRWISLLNILGVWIMGVAVIVVHSLFYLGMGTRHHILHECFHENNPAAAFSLLGLVGGMLMLNHGLVGGLLPGEHMFNVAELWYFLAAAIAFVLIARLILQVILLGLLGIRLKVELVRDNVAWGILDGGLIFTLFLILVALIV